MGVTKRPSENWDDFRYFLAVARTGTLSSAAERLGTEHTTVSRHIQSLEAELNTRLFHKSTTGYELTTAGQQIRELAEGIESAFISSRTTAAGEIRELDGVVRVGAPDALGSLFLAPRMHQLTKDHPRLEIEIFAVPRMFSLSKREADIAIMLSGAEHIRIASRRLTDYRMYIYGSKSYLEKAAPINDVKDLEQHPFVGYVEEGLFAPELNYLHAIEAHIEPHIRSTSLLPQVFTTLAGSALGILPAYVAASFPELVPILPRQVCLTRSFHMHVHRDHQKVAHIRAVANFIANLIHENELIFLKKNTE
jgi:DNA-binding transcriptional LysR family regulator